MGGTVQEPGARSPKDLLKRAGISLARAPACTLGQRMSHALPPAAAPGSWSESQSSACVTPYRMVWADVSWPLDTVKQLSNDSTRNPEAWPLQSANLSPGQGEGPRSLSFPADCLSGISTTPCHLVGETYWGAQGLREDFCFPSSLPSP